jgi:hypothetical protein
MKRGLLSLASVFLSLGMVDCSQGSSGEASSNAPPSFAVTYVVDHAGNVYLCSLNASTGALSNCTISNGGATFTQPYGIALNLLLPYVYVTDLTAGNVYLCSVNTSTFQLSSCTVSNGGASGWKPMGINTAVFNNSQVVYVIDNRSGTGNVYLCSTNSTTGALSGCSPTNGGVTWVDPGRIAFGAFGSLPYAFVTDSGAHNVYLCALNQNTGGLTSCVVSNGGQSTWDPGGITVASFDGGSTAYAYVTDSTHASVYLCSVNMSTGALSSCAASNGGVSGWAPTNIALAIESGNYFADVSDQNGNVYVCAINAGTGALSACTISDGGASFTQPEASFAF